MKPVYLLDTNIVSELIKVQPNEHVVKRVSENASVCAISSITYQELLTGLKRLPSGKRKDMIADFFYHYIAETFPVIDYDRSAAIIFADLFTECEKRGVVRPYADTQIAAAAKSCNMILVTRNIRAFMPFIQHCGLMAENWFDE